MRLKTFKLIREFDELPEGTIFLQFPEIENYYFVRAGHSSLGVVCDFNEELDDCLIPEESREVSDTLYFDMAEALLEEYANNYADLLLALKIKKQLREPLKKVLRNIKELKA